jgi:hypothetical protein
MCGFNGSDTHWQRFNVPNQNSPESGHGIGAQLDGLVSYDITDQFSVGVGDRYWTMWTTSAETDLFGAGVNVQSKFAVEQAAVYLQGSYKFESNCCAGPLK